MASAMAWHRTSASEWPRRPSSDGMSTPPRIHFLFGANW